MSASTNVLSAEAYHFAEIAARELEDMITDDFFEGDITVEPCGSDDGTSYIVIMTSSQTAHDLTKRFSDSVRITEGSNTRDVELIIRPFKPREAMI